MPIKNVPIVHKFGIISHSQRLELQERLARKVLEEGTRKPAGLTERKEQYCINEEFINEFNNTGSGSQERFQLEEKAEKIFLRAKRKAGLRNGGIGGHVDLQKAWKELSLLAMCESRRFQEGALNSLYESLYHAPISKNHVKSLIELAERSVRWLTGTAMEQPYLRTGELKLLKVSHLVFVRLYYHHLAADIMGLHAERTQLVDMLKGFQDQQDIYRPFPGSLLLVRVIVKVGMALRNGLENELKTLIEYNEKYQSKHKTLHKNPSFSTQQSSANQNADQLSKKTSSSHPVEAEFPLKIPTGYQPRVESDMSKDYSKESNAKEKKDDIVDRWDIASQSDSVFHEVETENPEDKFQIDLENIHDTSPTLWHCLELWRVVTHSNQSIEHAISELLNCSLEIYNEPVLDSIFALHTLAEVSKINATALKSIQFIARRDILHSTDDVIKASTRYRRPFPFQISGQQCSMKSTSEPKEYALDYVPSILSGLREFLDPRPIGESGSETPAGRDDETAVCDSGRQSTEPLHGPIFDENELVLSKFDNIEHHHEEDLATNELQIMDSSRPGSQEHRNSISDGSLADVSSLASNQSRTEIKTRSSKRRIRRRANTRDNEVDSDDSEEAEHQKEASFRTAARRQEFVTRESTMSIGLSAVKGRSSRSPCTITRPNTSIEAMTRWPWELIVTYVRCLGEICMNGTKSKIQRDALCGCSDENAGLLRMLKFQLPSSSENSDWSWRVRHVAVQELIKLCHHHNDNPNKEGLQNAAWGALLSHHSVEQDRRVLEAFKIARTEVNFGDNIEDTRAEPQCRKISLFSRICTNLSIIHLSPIEENLSKTDAFTESPRGPRTHRGERSYLDQGSQRGQGSNRPAKGEKSPRGRKSLAKEESLKGLTSPKDETSASNHEELEPDEDFPVTKKKQQKFGRVSIRDEILMANALKQKSETYANRSWFDVQDVVEDQWRKELSEQNDVIEKKKQMEADRTIELLSKQINKHL